MTPVTDRLTSRLTESYSTVCFSVEDTYNNVHNKTTTTTTALEPVFMIVEIYCVITTALWSRDGSAVVTTRHDQPSLIFDL